MIKHEFQEFRNKVAEQIPYALYNKINTFPKSQYTIKYTRARYPRTKPANEVQKTRKVGRYGISLRSSSKRVRGNVISNFMPVSARLTPVFLETRRNVKIFPSHLWEKLQKPCCSNRYYGLTFHGNTSRSEKTAGCPSRFRNFSLIVFYLCVDLG